MNEFIKKFSQYFIYENTAHVGLLYYNIKLLGVPSLLRCQGDYAIVVDPRAATAWLLFTGNDVEASEIYERIINFYNENIKEK